MRICYLDESGVPELTAQTSHFVLLGMSIQAETWKTKDRQIARIKRKYGLAGAEIHTAWMLRPYAEQNRIPKFREMDYDARRVAVQQERNKFLIQKAAVKGLSAVKSDKKNFAKTVAYIHLTHAERVNVLQDIADAVGAWADCQIFAECTDKTVFAGVPPATPPFEEGFAQVVTRYHRYLTDLNPQEHGLIVQDQNDSMARRLTALMRQYHQSGTRWTMKIRLIVETPLFVNSELTSLVQAADVCAYAVRRFCEKKETDLLDRIYPRFATANGRVVGVRHYTGSTICPCRICLNHRTLKQMSQAPAK
jgi:hypothetical protein